jgi:dipeptidyl aminopeptidase/acylaminoacyl peptidase
VRKSITFYSEGFRLVGDVFYPDGLQQSDTRAGIVLCHGYTGVKDLYLPDNARVLNDAGYVVLTFDYKGWGDSEGPRSRLAPYSRVADVQAALTYLGSLPEVDAARLGIYGTSYGGATVVWTAAIDPRVKCVVSVVGIGNGTRWMRSVRRPDEFHDLLARADQDRLRQAVEGKSEFVKREEILLPDRQSAELAAAARRNNPAAVSTIPLEYIHETLQFNPEWIVDRIAPRPVLFITTDDDRLVPPEESVALHARAGEPKKLVVLKGYGHYEVYLEPAFSEVMRETTAWFQQHLPAVH